MAKYKVEISGINTEDLKVLTNEEMVDLFSKFKNGDKFAREELIKGNLKLVLSILKKYSNRTENMDDLFQIGCIGLVKAIDNFDLSFDVKFSTYAVPMILGEIKRYLRDNTTIRVSRSLKDLAYQALKLKENLMMKNNKEPSISDIAKMLSVSEVELLNALDSLRDPVSMYEPIYNDGGDTIYLADQMEDKNNTTNSWDINISLNSAIENLKDKERKIILERFYLGKTQVEIAEELGISQAQVSRLEKNAVKNVKKLIK